MVPIFVGYDPRESVAYHTFCNSVIRHSSVPVSFVPLAKNLLNFDGRRDGSNDFVYSRFLVPHMMGYQGWALYADGDMLLRTDIAELWRQRDEWKAVMVVKHDYKTKHPQKYLGNANADYERKNWSSLILWNCGHFGNRGLTPKRISERDGAYLHRFQWLEDDRIGELPKAWNHLELEYEHEPEAKLVHFTVGTPCFAEYATTPFAGEWHNERHESQRPCVL